MQKLIGLAMILTVSASFPVAAVYEAAENGHTMYDRLGGDRARHLITELSPLDKAVTKEQFLGRKLSRGERREIRREKKLGTYKAPEDEFNLIDANQDGKLDEAELKEYYTRKAYARYSR